MVDPLSDKKFQRFDETDRQFLADFFVAHPKVGENFARYLALPPTLRPDFAKTDLQNIPRRGWVVRGIPDTESVFLHSVTLANMVQRALTKVVQHSPDMDADTASWMITRTFDMARVHDMIEVIATDFTPHDSVKSDDKHRVEMLAGKVLFEDPKYGKGLALSEEYIEQKTLASHIVHDFDKLHAVLIAAYFEHHYPDKAGLYDEFKAYAEPKLKTPIGKAYLKDFDANKAEVLADFDPAKGNAIG